MQTYKKRIFFHGTLTLSDLLSSLPLPPPPLPPLYLLIYFLLLLFLPHYSFCMVPPPSAPPPPPPFSTERNYMIIIRLYMGASFFI